MLHPQTATFARPAGQPDVQRVGAFVGSLFTFSTEKTSLAAQHLRDLHTGAHGLLEERDALKGKKGKARTRMKGFADRSLLFGVADGTGGVAWHPFVFGARPSAMGIPIGAASHNTGRSVGWRPDPILGMVAEDGPPDLMHAWPNAFAQACHLWDESLKDPQPVDDPRATRFGVFCAFAPFPGPSPEGQTFLTQAVHCVVNAVAEEKGCSVAILPTLADETYLPTGRFIEGRIPMGQKTQIQAWLQTLRADPHIPLQGADWMGQVPLDGTKPTPLAWFSRSDSPSAHLRLQALAWLARHAASPSGDTA